MDKIHQPSDKWAMFKNYMHNELGVTKEDIRDWIKEAVKEQADALISQQYGKFDLQQLVKSVVCERKYGSTTILDEIKDKVVKELSKNVELKFNLPKP